MSEEGSRLETAQECSSGERDRFEKNHEKRLLQIKYLEQENKNLISENDDLNTTLTINKQIILEFMKSDDPNLMAAITKAQSENEFLQNLVEQLKQERDRLNSSLLLN